MLLQTVLTTDPGRFDVKSRIFYFGQICDFRLVSLVILTSSIHRTTMSLRSTKRELTMEQIYNGMLPLGLSQRLNEPVMMLEKGEQAKPQLLAEPSPMIVYDKDYGGYLGYGYNVIAKRNYNTVWQ